MPRECHGSQCQENVIVPPVPEENHGPQCQGVELITAMRFSILNTYKVAHPASELRTALALERGCTDSYFLRYQYADNDSDDVGSRKK